jgi:acetyl esterase/lipase
MKRNTAVLPRLATNLFLMGALVCLASAAQSRAATIYLSDMIETSATVGWGALQYDKSIGGNTITIHGVTYARGLGAHAPSTIVYNLNKLFTSFTSDMGVDDEMVAQACGTVDFQVYVDDVLVYDSGTMKYNDAAKKVTVSVSGKTTLKLVVTDAGDGNGCDHADWAGAQLTPVDPNYVVDYPRIACVGNSITQGVGVANASTQGYVALVQKMFGTKYKVYNYGVSGRTMLKTGDYPYWNETDFTSLFTLKPDVITIMLGTNDTKSWNWNAAGYQADYTSFIDSLETIRDTVTGHNLHPQILLCLPPPIGTNTMGIDNTVMSGQVLPTVTALAKSKGDSLIDANTPLLAKMSMFPDGVHPDTNGNKVLADLFYESLQNFAFKQTPPRKLLWYGSAPGATGNDTLDKPMLRVFPAPDSNRNGTAVIICPGGGYTGLSMGYEGTDVAQWFTTYGVTAFVLRYRLSPYHHPIELNDAKRAMRIVRYYAANYKIDTTKIGIMGFSAGGHLASTLGTHFDNGTAGSLDPIDRKKSRPDFMALIYPVITMTGPYTHTGSRDALLGTNPSPSAALLDSLSNQKQVTAQTPPTFLDHGDADNVVPIQNSQMFDSACKANHVVDTFVVDPGKGHGFGMGGIWPPILISWLKGHGIITKPTAVADGHAARRQAATTFSAMLIPHQGIRITVSSSSVKRVEIFSISGRQIAAINVTGAKEFLWKPPVQGIYILRAAAAKGMITRFIGFTN